MAAPPKLRRLAAKGFNVPSEMRPFVNQLLDTTNSFFADTSNALNKRLTLGANVVTEVKTVTVYAPEQEWTAITTFNTAGVAAYTSDSYSGVRYRMEPNGLVRLEISLTCPSTATISLFTMPSGYRPTAGFNFAGSAGGGSGTACSFSFSTGGAVVKDGGAYTFMSSVLTYTASTPAIPAAFTGVNWPLVLQPQRVRMTPESLVLPLRYQDLDNTTAQIPAAPPDCALDVQGNVVIRSIYGLQPGRRYSLSFLLVE